MMSSKSELTKTIETQQAQITRLQQRLTDIVAAYKNLKTEKEALESTVQALTSNSAPTESIETDNESKETNESGSEAESISRSSESQISRENFRTLQQSVVVLTEQKNRMEQIFQLDKKKLKTENDELKKLLEEIKAENIVLKEKSDQEIKELKNSLRQSQRDHERELANHNVTIRELQTLISTERKKCETIEQQFDECRAKILTLENQLDTLKKQHNQLNNQYQTKLNESREKDLIDSDELKRSKEKISELMSKLQGLEMKYSDQLRTESKRSQESEKNLSDIRNEHAQKLTITETHISELSEQIGFIEKQRAQDQMIIQKLKERIAQLDIENSLLTKASSTSTEHDDIIPNNDEDNHYDLDTLLKRISKLKVLIRVANDRFGKSFTIEEILNIDREITLDTINGNHFSGENNKILHNKCQEEIDRLKSELDKYRSKTVAAFKAKTFKDTNNTKEIDELRSQIEHLREKLSQSQTLYNDENIRHNQVVEKLELCLTNIRNQHRLEIEQILNRTRAQLNELESELEKQRERTIRLLTEKDREVETLKNQMKISSQFEPSISHSSSTSSDLKQNEELPTTIMNELFSHHLSSSTIGGPMTLNSETNLLYFIQEQQLREQELISLRKQRHELELTIRDLNKKHSFEISQLQINIEQLTDDLEHMKLSTKRHEVLTKNEHNIDYIKNVFYHYLLATDTQVKHTMANALMTILHFSTKEKAKVENQKSSNSLTSGSWFYTK